MVNEKLTRATIVVEIAGSGAQFAQFRPAATRFPRNAASLNH